MTTGAKPERFSMRVPSSLVYLDQIVDDSQSFLSNHIQDEDFVYRVVLSVTEAVTNAMKHGNKFDESRYVTLDLSVNDSEVRVSVEDEGTGFARKEIRNPLDKENLTRPSGRGIFLMETMADKMVFENDGRCIRLEFKYPESGASPH